MRFYPIPKSFHFSLSVNASYRKIFKPKSRGCETSWDLNERRMYHDKNCYGQSAVVAQHWALSCPKHHTCYCRKVLATNMLVNRGPEGHWEKIRFLSCVFSLQQPHAYKAHPSSWYKNIERHAAHTIVSWPNPKQWVVVHTSGLMMITRQSIYSLNHHKGKWVNWKHTVSCIV